MLHINDRSLLEYRVKDEKLSELRQTIDELKR